LSVLGKPTLLQSTFESKIESILVILPFFTTSIQQCSIATYGGAKFLGAVFLDPDARLLLDDVNH
jgi:hypothetical protein